jgi:hypothetical protein
MRHFCFLFLFLFSLACFSQVTVNITLNPSDTGKTIPSDFAGLSFEKNCLNRGYFGPADDTLIQLFRTCGIKSMRVGANAVDRDQLSTVADSDHFTRGELDDLFHFADSAGCKVLLGLNLKDYNFPLADSEAVYVIKNYDSLLFGFEVGNEPDLYFRDTLHYKSYTLTDYENDYRSYYDTIRRHNPTAVFTGPGCASAFTEWTEPFRKHMDTLKYFSMLTQHYYGGDTNAKTIPVQIDSLLSKHKLRHVSKEVDSLVKCADSILFRMSECNSWDHGGKKGVSDAFASALWVLDYMYALADKGCAGVNFHGGLDGEYTVFSKKNNIYHARPIAYGILAFQIGSKGRFISSKVIKTDSINLESYSVIDSIKSICTTIINKETDTSKYAVINLVAGDTHYRSAEYVQLSSDSLGDTDTVTLGGQVVNSKGIISPYNWKSLPVVTNTTQIRVRGGSAVVIRFHPKIGNSINDYSGKNKHFLNLYPNPVSEKVTISTDMTGHSVISIYNLQGQILLQQQVQQGKTDIDISELAKGVYIVRLTCNAGAEAGRIIKE